MTDLRPKREAGMNFPLGKHVAGTYGVFAEDGGRPLAGKARRGGLSEITMAERVLASCVFQRGP